MFIGKYYYKLQANSRVSLPKAFRNNQNKWVITRGLDGCLFIFESDSFKREVENLAQRSFTKKAHRDLIRIMTNEAMQATVDANGRVHLPEYLISYANLKDELVIVGSFNRIEIWNRDDYHQYSSQLENQAEIIAESIEIQQ